VIDEAVAIRQKMYSIMEEKKMSRKPESKRERGRKRDSA